MKENKDIFRTAALFALICYWLVIFTLEIHKPGFTPVGAFDTSPPSFTLRAILHFFNLLSLLTLPFLLLALFGMLQGARKLKKILFLFSAICLSLLYHIAFFLLLYRHFNHFGFDYNYFWYNRSIAVITLFRTHWAISTFLVVSMVGYGICTYYVFRVFSKSLQKPKKSAAIFSAIFLVSIFMQAITFFSVRGELVDFVYRNFTSHSEAGQLYYDEYVRNLYEKHQAPFTFSNQADDSALGNRIFMLELESVSSLLVSDGVTPNLLKKSSEGIYFPNFYASSVQTIRGQESLLCGMPPSIRETLVAEASQDELSALPCLPNILKQLGYKTLYFKSDRLDFADTDEFVAAIGFDEQHQEDIMQPQDPKHTWGYREDIFFKRIFEYLEKFEPDEKLFVFIAVSATNHFPFDSVDVEFQQSIPYPQTTNFKQQLSNTTFVQDIYLEQFLSQFDDRYGHDSTLVVDSDQSWPIQIHYNNYFNEFGAYEENFLMPFLFVPPRNNREQFFVNTVINDRYSQTDVLATFIDIIDPDNTYSFLGESFASKIYRDFHAEQPTETKTKISVQPYNGGYIGLVQYPKKYLFDIANNRIEFYDLQNDPNELRPTIFDDPKLYFSLITQYFNSEDVDTL